MRQTGARAQAMFNHSRSNLPRPGAWTGVSRNGREMHSPAFGYEQRSIGRLKRLYDQASQLARIGGWECDLATETLTWTDGVYDLFEVPRGALLRRSTIVDLYEDDSRRQMETMRAEAIRSGGSFVLDARVRTRLGATRWMRLSANVAYRDGKPDRIFGAKQDITQERAAWDRLRELAERDPLTGLANRGVFEERCHHLIKAEAGEPAISALALVDLDRFKQVNDRLGHAAGDECLREMAARLRRVFPDALLIARIGGDEFAVLLGGPLLSLEISQILERAVRRLGRPIFWRNMRLDVGASIGVAPLRRGAHRDPSQLFVEADAALYAAKAAGRNGFRIFGQEGEIRQVPSERPLRLA